MVYYLGIQPTQTGSSLKNELGSFALLHNFLTWHNLSNVLRFTLYVLILLIDYYVLISAILVVQAQALY